MSRACPSRLFSTWQQAVPEGKGTHETRGQHDIGFLAWGGRNCTETRFVRQRAKHNSGGVAQGAGTEASATQCTTSGELFPAPVSDGRVTRDGGGAEPNPVGGRRRGGLRSRLQAGSGPCAGLGGNSPRRETCGHVHRRRVSMFAEGGGEGWYSRSAPGLPALVLPEAAALCNGRVERGTRLGPTGGLRSAFESSGKANDMQRPLRTGTLRRCDRLPFRAKRAERERVAATLQIAVARSRVGCVSPGSRSSQAGR